MTKKLIKTIACVLACVCLWGWCVSQSAGQSRSGLSIGKVGTLGKIGGSSTSSHSFSRYSYGLGSLQSGGSSSSRGGSILRSSIGATSFSIRSNIGLSRSSALRSTMTTGSSMNITSSSSGASIGSSTSSVTGSKGSTLYKVVGSKIRYQSAGRGLLSDSDAITIAAAQTYLNAMGNISSSISKEKAITSFVPDQPSQFRDRLVNGEHAFRNGKFLDALNQFELAAYMAPHAPETLLSIAHAKFALSNYSYASSAYYIRQALKYFPELPLVLLKPRRFYGSAAIYVSHLEQLEKHLDTFPDDADALLVLAYFRWFRNDVESTHEALSKALASAKQNKNQYMLEAIDTFWSGMVASGKVEGELKPAAPPADEENKDSSKTEKGGEKKSKAAPSSEK